MQQAGAGHRAGLVRLGLLTGEQSAGFFFVLLTLSLFCAGTAGTTGTPHKQGLPGVPALFKQRGQRGQKRGYPQQKMSYPLILLNK